MQRITPLNYCSPDLLYAISRKKEKRFDGAKG